MESINVDFSNSGTSSRLVGNNNDEHLLNFAGQTSQLVVIDSGIKDYDQLLEGLSADTAVLVLDSSADGVSQIDAAINQFESLGGLHIFSHGSAGKLQLGTTQLSVASLPIYEDMLERWDDVLTDTADILLYGCNVAEGETGQIFCRRLVLLQELISQLLPI